MRFGGWRRLRAMAFPKGARMLAIVAENLKLILLFLLVVMIIGLSRLGNERWMTRPIHQRHAGMRERKVRCKRSPRQRA